MKESKYFNIIFTDNDNIIFELLNEEFIIMKQLKFNLQNQFDEFIKTFHKAQECNLIDYLTIENIHSHSFIRMNKLKEL